jgi:hypothetical protein
MTITLTAGRLAMAGINKFKLLAGRKVAESSSDAVPDDAVPIDDDP